MAAETTEKQKDRPKTYTGMGRREMQDTSRRILSVALSALALAILAAVLVVVITRGYRFGKALFIETPAGYDRTTVLVKVENGESAAQLASELADRGLITDALLFRVKGKLYSYEPKAGAYQLSASMTDREIWEAVSGRAKDR